VAADDDCCKVATGYYCAYGYKMRSMECEEWPDLCDFMNVLRRARFMNFSVQSNRDAILNSFMNLKVDAPFALDKRFPLNKVYVNLTCSGYSEFIRQVAQALNQKEREKEVDRKANASNANSEVSNLKFTFDDASSGFHKGIQSLLQLACKRHEVYGRLEFEAKYDLKWCEGVPPVIPPEPPVIPPAPPTEPSPPNRDFNYREMKEKIRESFSDLENYVIDRNSLSTVRCIPTDDVTVVRDLDDNEVIGANYVLVYASAALTACRANTAVVNINVFEYNVRENTFVRFLQQRIGNASPLVVNFFSDEEESGSSGWKTSSSKSKRNGKSTVKKNHSRSSFEVLENFE